jgi:hypothetical protein
VRSKFRAVPTLALAAALLGAAAPAQAQEWRTITSARQVQGERALRVDLTYGAGELRVQPASGTLLYRLQMRYDERQFRPVTAYDRATGRLRLGVEGIRRNQRVQRGGNATVELAPSVPTDLKLEFGAGQANLELGGLSLRSVDLSTGASDTQVRWSAPNRVPAGTVKIASGASSIRVRGLGNARAERLQFEGGVGEATLEFDGAWNRSTSLDVDMGVGSLTLRIPRSLGVRIEKDSFLASFSPSGMVRRGDAWYTRNWDGARNKLTVRISAALGSINVQWID